MKNAILFVVGLVAAMMSMAANAALPAGVATGFTSVQTNLQDVFDLALPVVVLGITLVLIIKFMKKFSNKI